MEHQISSSEEYQYKDHTISERPGPTSQAGEVLHGQPGGSLERSHGHNNQLPMPNSLVRLKNIDSTTPEGRRNYLQQLHAKQVDLMFKDKSTTGSTTPQQLELHKLKNEIIILQMRIREDESEHVASRPIPVCVSLRRCEGNDFFFLNECFISSTDYNRQM
jgi:hypothetical protein